METNKLPYHHGNLRETLIEKGIELVSTQGLTGFSLRKVAAACGVSHAAPYSHFKNKEELLDVMQAHVTDQFCQWLERTITEHPGDPKLMAYLGAAYLSFFMKNPCYFSFLYTHSNMQIDLTAAEAPGNYKPFEIYKSVLLQVLDEAHYPEEKREDAVVTLLALVHGITALATMDNVHYEHDWEKKIVDFMEIFKCSM